MRTRSEYSRDLAVVERLVDRSARLPQPVFRVPVFSLHVIDFDVVLSEEFFRNVQQLTVATGSGAFLFGVLAPDPEENHYAHFGTFPFLRFTPSDTPNDYITALHADPGGSAADAIAYNSEVIVIYPETARWLIYGDRNFELGLVAAMDESAAATITAHPPARLFEMADAITELLPPVFRGAVPSDIGTALLQNYGNPSSPAA